MGRVSRLLPVGAVVECANTSARKAKIFTVLGLRCTKRRLRSAGVGSIVGVTITKGPREMRHKMYRALVIRQRAPWSRYMGKVVCQDNAVLLLDDSMAVQKGTIRGVIARQVTLNPRYAQLAGRLV